MWTWLDVGTIAFEPLGYPLSWIELVGTVLYLLSVVLIARRNLWTWPVGIVSVILYAALFWQIRLYSDAIEQAYYLGVSVYGWWHWVRVRETPQQPVPVGYGTPREIAAAVAVTVAGSLAWGAAMTRIHLWLPVLFPEPADWPWTDAATTVTSLVAMWLLTRRRVESWIWWIAVDVVGVWLYAVKEVRFVSLLYAVLLVLAIGGYAGWHRGRRAPGAPQPA